MAGLDPAIQLQAKVSMTLEPPLNARDTDDLLARKDELVERVARMARAAGIALDYSYDMMLHARQAGFRDPDFLEALVELEAIKYTLCARRLREEVGE